MRQQSKNGNREFSEVTNKDQFSYINDQYIKGKRVCIKGMPQEILAELEILPPDDHIHLSFPEPLPQGCIIRNNIIIYAIANRYIEVYLKKYSFERNHGEFEFIKALIAHNYRLEARLKVEELNFLAESFRLSKYSINPTIQNMPICVQLAFDTLRPTILEEIPECSLEVFDDENLKRKEIRAIQKSLKVLYIEDLFKESDFSSLDPAFLNLKEFLGTKFNKEIELLKKDGIKSLLIYPVIYTNLKKEKTAVGYFKITSNSESISTNILTRLSEFSQTLVDNIRDANIEIINAPQKVVNVSKGGIQIKVKDKDVIDIFQANSDEVVLDVKPKPTFRFTLFAKVANIFVNSDKTYTIGMKVIGGEERRGIDDWNKYVEMIQNNLKA